MSNATRLRGPRSLRGLLTALFAALAVPLLALQVWWGYHDYRAARERAWADALAFADATELAVRQFMTQSRDLLDATVRQRGADWMRDGACASEMRSVIEALPFLANALVVRSDGRVLCSALSSAVDANALEWPWFADFQRTGESLVGDPAEGDFVQGWLLPLVTAIRGPDGTLEGALVGAVSLSELSGLLGGIAPPDEHLTSITTADGIVIARSHDAERWIGQHIPPPTGSDELVAPGRWVASGPDLAGIARTWGQVRSANGWMVYVGVPDASVYGPAMREWAQHVGATVLVVLLGVIVAALSYTRIARSLRELADRTRTAAAGDIVPLLPDTPSEVSQVVEQFNETLRARDRAETAERRARQRFQSLFDNAVFGLYVSTADGRFLQANFALASMLRYPSVEALMEAGPGALYPDPQHRGELIGYALEAGAVEPQEIDWLRADGVPITVRVAGKMIEGPSGELVFEMIVQDITEEKRTEEELRQTQKMEAIGQLAGGIAHDFNNLLTVIGGNVELLGEDLPPGSSELRDDLAQISKATHRAASLTRRLLAFSRRDRRGQQVIDVNEVLPELRKMLVPLIGENVAFETRLGPGPLRVHMDPGELEQVVLNLVLNARDAMPRGGRVVIETRPARRGEVATAEDRGAGPDGVELAVVDTGVGMDAATRPRIFEPFYTTKPMGEGTGLGLSTVYGIVKRSGGAIAVESEPGRGTRMRLWLPLAPARTEAHERLPVATALADGDERIMVVEDDELVRTFVRRALVEAGYDVVVADSGGIALELLRAKGDDIDLVLTDVVMPGLSGPELAERLEVAAPEIPILFMSGYVDNSFLSRALEDDPERLLRKPFTAAELRRRVRDALDRQRRAPTVR